MLTSPDPRGTPAAPVRPVAARAHSFPATASAGLALRPGGFALATPTALSMSRKARKAPPAFPNRPRTQWPGPALTPPPLGPLPDPPGLAHGGPWRLSIPMPSFSPDRPCSAPPTASPGARRAGHGGGGAPPAAAAYCSAVGGWGGVEPVHTAGDGDEVMSAAASPAVWRRASASAAVPSAPDTPHMPHPPHPLRHQLHDSGEDAGDYFGSAALASGMCEAMAAFSPGLAPTPAPTPLAAPFAPPPGVGASLRSVNERVAGHHHALHARGALPRAASYIGGAAAARDGPYTPILAQTPTHARTPTQAHTPALLHSPARAHGSSHTPTHAHSHAHAHGRPAMRRFCTSPYPQRAPLTAHPSDWVSLDRLDRLGPDRERSPATPRSPRTPRSPCTPVPGAQGPHDTLAALHRNAPLLLTRPETFDVRLKQPPQKDGAATAPPTSGGQPAAQWLVHSQYLVHQSRLLRELLCGCAAGAGSGGGSSGGSSSSAESPPRTPGARRGARVLPTPPETLTDVLLPVPHPPSLALLLRWIYFGDEAELVAAITARAVTWSALASNVHYLDMDQHTKRAMGRIYARWIMPAGDAAALSPRHSADYGVGASRIAVTPPTPPAAAAAVTPGQRAPTPIPDADRLALSDDDDDESDWMSVSDSFDVDDDALVARFSML